MSGYFCHDAIVYNELDITGFDIYNIYCMTWINRLYIFFLGVLLTITIGFGLATFYPEPVRPQYPIETKLAFIPDSCRVSPETARSSECEKYLQEDQMKRQEAQSQYELDLREFNNRNAGYTRTAVFFGVTLGAFFALAGLALIRKSKLVANGLLLSGLLTAVLTRFVIHLASLGAPVTGTEKANTIGYVEFSVLTLLSLSVIWVGLNTLKDTSS